MKYFLDTEFIEGFHKPIFGKRRHFIDLISIGIYAEDGRSYYAISTEFNHNDADDWVKENVISKLPRKNVSFYDSPREKQESLLWKCNARIAKEIREFVFDKQIEFEKGDVKWNNPEFYAYYADYDWVVFCSLFGRMIDLPMGFSMYCNDLKQSLDEFVKINMKSGYGLWNDYKKSSSHPDLREHTFDECLERIKLSGNYPNQTDEHNAIDDAKWNFDLYKFLNALTK